MKPVFNKKIGMYLNEKDTLETTRKKMLEFVNMARKKEYSDMDIVDVILSQFIFDYVQEKVEQKNKEMIKIINGYKNPYPKDIFRWDNKESPKCTMGRINELNYNIVENVKEKLIKLLKEGK